MEEKVMNERMLYKHFKKVFAILMSVILLISVFGNQTVLKVSAEEGEPTITYCFDDRGKPDAFAD